MPSKYTHKLLSGCQPPSARGHMASHFACRAVANEAKTSGNCQINRGTRAYCLPAAPRFIVHTRLSANSDYDLRNNEKNEIGQIPVAREGERD
jgi:hypothetical protein